MFDFGCIRQFILKYYKTVAKCSIIEGWRSQNSAKKPLKINQLHSAFNQNLAKYNGVSTKYLENHANLTIFKQEPPSISAITRATLLTDKLRNVSSVARWKDLRVKHYPPFVYDVLDKTSENEVSI